MFDYRTAADNRYQILRMRIITDHFTGRSLQNFPADQRPHHIGHKITGIDFDVPGEKGKYPEIHYPQLPVRPVVGLRIDFGDGIVIGGTDLIGEKSTVRINTGKLIPAAVINAMKLTSYFLSFSNQEALILI